MRAAESSRRTRLPGAAGFCAALLAPEAGGPAAREAARSVERYAARLPAPVRAAARAGFLGVVAASLATTGRPLGRLDLDRREEVLSRLAAWPATNPLVEGLKALVLLATGSDRYAEDLLARSNRTPPARPDADIDVTPAAWWPSRSRCDAVVVGSGAGGAMVARTLARAGLEVVVVEEGRRFTVEEFRTSQPLDRFSELYRDAGATAALGRPPVALPIGRGVGGTTLVNSGTCYRPPRRVLERWRDEAGLALADPDAFGPWLDEVEETLAVGPVPPEVMGANGRLVLTGAEVLGWRSGPLLRNAPGCGGCCQCAIGCPRNAKFGVHLNALPQASAAGARLVSEARVVRVMHEGGRASGVLARRADGSTIELRAPRVVVCAGATETPALLRRSGLGAHPALGRRLAIHPAAGVLGRFEDPVVAWEGVLQSAAVEEFHEDGILVEATSTPPGMGSMTLPGVGRRLLRALEDAEHLASLGAMVADRPSGRVYGARRPIVRYDLDRRDGALLVRAIEVMGRLLFAAGATEVYPGLPGHAVVRSPDELAGAVASADPRGLKLAAFHPTGTAGAGRDPEQFAVDETGRLRGLEGLWVADASILPSCPEVNPQVSIMAMALAVADAIASA